MGTTVAFPHQQPPGYEWLGDETPFDPTRHLQLEPPESIIRLDALGYAPDAIATKASPIAVSSPFRVLSDEGAALLLDTARRLRAFAHPAGDRIECMTRGGCYRSKWLRDFCVSRDVTEHLATVYEVDVAPHAMPLHLGHLNFDPPVAEKPVDKWHHDTLALDYVLMVTDPAKVAGGAFEYFLGTKADAAAYAERQEPFPTERVVKPHFPGPGYAVALHGDMVVHHVAPLTAPCERITLVNGYTSTDPMTDEQSRTVDLIGVDDHACLYTEWAKFAAWRSHGRLRNLIDSLEYNRDPHEVADQLQNAIDDVQRAIDDMRAGERPISHYET